MSRTESYGRTYQRCIQGEGREKHCLIADTLLAHFSKYAIEGNLHIAVLMLIKKIFLEKTGCRETQDASLCMHPT